MNADSLLGLLQFSDGLFPAGAYAHSYGLEMYVQREIVRDAAGAGQFLRAYMQGAAALADAAAAVHAWRGACHEDLGLCLELDAILDAMKPAAELRDASRQLGRQTLRILSALQDDRLVDEFVRRVDADTTPCHHAVVFGVAGGSMQWTAEEAALGYLYSSAAGIVGAALRLIPLGQLQGQLILRETAPLIAALAAKAVAVNVDEMSSFAPGLEIAAMRHARLEARLFRS
jgi:urease accessory protein